MTIDQVVDKLRNEQQQRLAHRFPCRAVMVRNISDYCDLLDKLRQIEGVQFVSSSSLFSGEDVMPRYENLLKNEYAAKWLVLTGVSEYLRLFSKSEAQSQRFAKLWSHNFPSSNLGRIIIPLWGCEAQWHDQALHLTEDPRKEEIYISCMDSNQEEQELNITVLSDAFRQYKNQLYTGHVVILDGLKAWYEYWAAPERHTDLTLITGRYSSVLPINGSISIRVVQNALTFIQNRMGGAKILSEDLCPEDAQKLLFDYALSGVSLEQATLSILNAATFVPADIMGKWRVFTKGQRQLVRLWIEEHPDDSYLYHCINGAVDDLSIEKRILHEIFLVKASHPAWITESQQLIHAMKITRDDLYFESLDQIPSFSERLHFLSGSTQKERSYLLHMAGLWLREDEEEVYNSAELKTIYPELYAYLDGKPYDEDLRRYMKLYKTHKLANTLPADEQMYFAGIQPEDYDYRFPVISSALDDSSIVLWVDALGIEWMPLLLWALKKITECRIVSVSVGQANLPAETEFNKQWEKMPNPHDKLDALDKLAHKGVVDDPNYYSCVEEQIDFVIKRITARVEKLLKDYHRVIITGDHGASRLAARFFHRREGISLPRGAKALNHGRYALLASSSFEPSETQSSGKDDAGNHYLIFKNYDHFTQSGFAGGAEDDIPIFGEVHGGATPEEMLVPIIVFESKKPIELKAKWEKNPVKISNKKVTVKVSFNVPVTTLDVRINTITAQSRSSPDGKHWTIVFKDVQDGVYEVTVSANGKLVPIDHLIIQPAIGNAGGDLDW